MDPLPDKLETEAYNNTKRDHSAIRIQNVDFAYRLQGGVRFGVLKNTTFSVPYGQIVGLVGRNASGKSTLLSVLRGFLVPQSGILTIGSKIIFKSGKRLDSPDISLITQRADAGLAPTMTVFENYVLASKTRHQCLTWAYSKRTKDQCAILLKKAGMGLENKMEEQTRFLSGGQQQALSVLLSIDNTDSVLLLDEPTASLDAFSGSRILDLAITAMLSKSGSVILVSHRLHDIIERCQRIVVLNRGELVADLDNSSFNYSEKELEGLME